MKEIEFEKATTWNIISAIEKSGVKNIKLLHIFEVDNQWKTIDKWSVTKENMDLIFISKILIVNFSYFDFFSVKIYIDEDEVVIYIKK